MSENQTGIDCITDRQVKEWMTCLALKYRLCLEEFDLVFDDLWKLKMRLLSGWRECGRSLFPRDVHIYSPLLQIPDSCRLGTASWSPSAWIVAIYSSRLFRRWLVLVNLTMFCCGHVPSVQSFLKALRLHVQFSYRPDSRNLLAAIFNPCQFFAEV